MRQDGARVGEKDVRGRFSLILKIIWLRLQRAFLRWQLRRRGIDPDTLPGMTELRREYEEELARLKREDQRKKVAD